MSGEEAYWTIKSAARERHMLDEAPEYVAIEVPKNTATGVVCAFFATVLGFALIWHIWWMAALGFLGAFVTFVVFAWRDISEEEIPVEEVERIDRRNRERRRAALEAVS